MTVVCSLHASSCCITNVTVICSNRLVYSSCYDLLQSILSLLIPLLNTVLVSLLAKMYPTAHLFSDFGSDLFSIVYPYRIILFELALLCTVVNTRDHAMTLSQFVAATVRAL